MDFLQWIWYLLFTATPLATTLGCWLTFWACGLRTRHKSVRLLFKCLPLPWQQEGFEGYRLLRGQRGCPWSQPARIEGPHRRRREIDGNPQELADVGLKCIQVWPITQFFLSTICKKIIKYPSSGRTSNSLISVWNLERLLEITRRPLRTLNLLLVLHVLLLELRQCRDPSCVQR